MRRDVWMVDKFVEQSLREKKFESEEECAIAMRYWLVSKGYTKLLHSTDDELAIEDDAHSVPGVTPSEGVQLQYEILRERDA